MIKKLKKILPKKLLPRLLLIFFLPLILIQCLAIFLFYERHWEKIINRFSNIAVNQVNLLIYEYKEEGLKKTQGIAKTLNIEFSLNKMIDNNLGKKKSFFEKRIHKNISNRVGEKIDIIFDKNSVILQKNLDNESVFIKFPRKYLLSETPTILFLWIISSSLVLSIIAFLFLRIQIRAIYRLAKSAEDFGQGKPIRKFKPEGAMEIRLAGNAFIKMRKRINDHISQRTRFLAGISHDLGTIITRIKLRLELINNLPESNAIKNDVETMQMFLKEYLDYSEKININKFSEVKILNLIEKVINSSKYKNKKISIVCKKTLTLNTDKNSLYRIIFNLFENASRFGDQIIISAKKEFNTLVINIEDDGPGIHAKHKEKVFKPFYKIDNSRNLNQGGTGLGLSIANELTKKIKGEISLSDSKKLKGSCFSIILSA
jgi:two-component system osmolarity sensor histidine kinase EnvZ